MRKSILAVLTASVISFGVFADDSTLSSRDIGVAQNAATNIYQATYGQDIAEAADFSSYEQLPAKADPANPGHELRLVKFHVQDLVRKTRDDVVIEISYTGAVTGTSIEYVGK